MFGITLFFIFTFEELLGLINSLAELGMIYVPTVSIGIYYKHQTISVGWNYYCTLIPLLFYWPLCLVPPLLCVGGGGDIIH